MVGGLATELDQESAEGTRSIMTITVDTVVVRDSEPIPAMVDEDVVVLSLRAEAYFGFNRMGSEIWTMLSEPRRVGDICASLVELYDADVMTVNRDVTTFLEALIQRRLLRVNGETIG